MPKKNYDKKQLIIISFIALFFFMLLGLNSRLSELFHLTDQQAVMQTKVVSLKETEMTLNTQIAVATSDLAVEGWARNQAHMAQNGDQVIVPLQPTTSSIIQGITPTPTSAPLENWQIWWDLLFAK